MAYELWKIGNYKKRSTLAPKRTSIPNVEMSTVGSPTPAAGRFCPAGVGDVAAIFPPVVGVAVGLLPVVGVTVVVGVGVFVLVIVAEGLVVGVAVPVTPVVGVVVTGTVGVGVEIPSPIQIWILLISLQEDPDPTLLQTTWFPEIVTL